MSSPFSTPDFSGKGSNLHIQSTHSLLYSERPTCRTPPSLCATSRSAPGQWRGWPPGWGCPGTLWRAGYLRPGLVLLTLLLLLQNSQVHVDKFIACLLSGAVTIQTTIFKFYHDSKQTKVVPLLFGKILAFEKWRKEHCRKEGNGFSLWQNISFFTLAVGELSCSPGHNFFVV